MTAHRFPQSRSSSPPLSMGWSGTASRAALFGLVAYATYDLSNLATLKSWPIGLALIDMAWGSALSAMSAVAGRAAHGWSASG